ncbi:probable phosphoglycerate mutase [Verrucomicrobium sp. GAS474]|uniref:histidine phosphatase family protein n=1 Tax=Verrucomicrobium sp. GAS474 TaxID=1882831 RepID=UPI0008793F63|nr:histidine phosphatase family protein [Verrucomicrobium sp. GAS474]SDU18452.1 probable phosphoglycerate mutase [Verrucomicrobium sp. GAS474]
MGSETRIMINIESSPLCLYLIRHGETAWSISSRHTSTTDLPLTEHGEEEALLLEKRLRDVKFTRVLTSPRQRARRTCVLAGLDATAEIDQDLAEWNYGDYEGRHSIDILAERPDWDIFTEGCFGGEMPGQVSARADELIARLRLLKGNVALFSHGQFGCVFAARWIGLPVVQSRHFVIGTASLSILSYDPHHPQVPVIARWNTASSEAPAAPFLHLGDVRTMKQRALDRWENEGGEIPTAGLAPVQAPARTDSNQADVIEQAIGPST